MRVSNYLFFGVVINQVLLALGVPYETNFGEPTLVKEARNFGGIFGGGSGNGAGAGVGGSGGIFPGSGGGNNVKFYKLVVSTLPPKLITTKAPVKETCTVDKPTCCKFLCNTDCNPAGTGGANACVDATGTAEAGTPCLNVDKCQGCKTAPATVIGPDCAPTNPECKPTGTMKLCPA